MNGKGAGRGGNTTSLNIDDVFFFVMSVWYLWLGFSPQAYMQPHLLGNEFTHLEFPRRVQRKEVGKRMLYRDFNMTGW